MREKDELSMLINLFKEVILENNYYLLHSLRSYYDKLLLQKAAKKILSEEYEILKNMVIKLNNEPFIIDHEKSILKFENQLPTEEELTEVETDFNELIKSEKKKIRHYLKAEFQLLTYCQKKAFLEIINFLTPRRKNYGQEYFKLKGYAGTGKSFLIVQLIKYCFIKKLNIIVVCPTNKAVKNIQLLAENEGLEIKATTLAKLLDLQPEIDENKGQEIFVSVDTDKELKYDVIFIDEYSMVSTELLQLLDTKLYQTLYYNKVVFIGDPAQLPPINENEPPVENWPKIKYYAELFEVVRYDGEIIRIAETIRNNPLYNKRIYPFMTTGDQSIICLPKHDWLSQAKTFFADQKFALDPNFCRILVWRNKTADLLNKHIRNHLFGENAKPFEKGDLLIAKTPVFRPHFNPQNEELEWQIMMNNSEECVVIDKAILAQKTLTLFKRTYLFNYWKVPVFIPEMGDFELEILDEKEKPEYEKIKQEIRESIKISDKPKYGQWQEYQILEKSFDNCPFAYSITTHKAQGSTIDHVFINIKDFWGCSDLQKLQYTAITRAKTRVWIPL